MTFDTYPEPYSGRIGEPGLSGIAEDEFLTGVPCMAKDDLSAISMPPAVEGENIDTEPNRDVRRRSFLKSMGVAGVALSAGSLLPSVLNAEEKHGNLTKGDAAILRFLAAAEILETDLWLQYNEFGGTQDGEVEKLASQFIPGYPSTPQEELPLLAGLAPAR